MISKIRHSALLLAAAAIAVSMASVPIRAADGSKTLRHRIKVLENALATTQEELAQTEADVESTRSELDGIQSNLTTALSNIQTLQAKLEYMRVENDPINGLVGPHVIFEGCNVHVRSGSGTTGDNGGLTGRGNLIVGYNEQGDQVIYGRSGSHNLVVGQGHEYSKAGGFVAGNNNKITGWSCSISGGTYNRASGLSASVSGGSDNKATGDYASIGAGLNNIASGGASSVSGGDNNTASQPFASVSGGSSNTAGGYQSSVSGGRENTASGQYSSISGGRAHATSGIYDWAAGSLAEDLYAVTLCPRMRARCVGTRYTLFMEYPVILFDGVCNYCHSVCNFIIRHDPAKRFRFAHLQSAAGQALLKQYGFAPDMLDSVVLIDDGKAYLKSDVTARIASRLTGVARTAVVLRIVPRFVRNFGYDIIARNRYRWWGKQDACIVPTPDVRDRFLT